MTTATIACWVLVVLSTVSVVTEGYLAFCAPKLWEGRMWLLQITHTPQGPSILESITDFSIDVVGQRFATTETKIQDGKQSTVFTLYYFPAHKVFTVLDGVCTVRHVDGAVTPNCMELPDNHTLEYLNEFLPTFGSTYCAGVRGQVDGMSYLYSVTPGIGGNIPLMRESHGMMEGMPVYRVYNFINSTLGVKNPEIFTPPSNCTSHPQVETLLSMEVAWPLFNGIDKGRQ